MDTEMTFGCCGDLETDKCEVLCTSIISSRIGLLWNLIVVARRCHVKLFSTSQFQPESVLDLPHDASLFLYLTSLTEERNLHLCISKTFLCTTEGDFAFLFK